MSADTGANRGILAGYSQDPLRLTADLILDRHHADLPDLSRVAVLVPTLNVGPELRRRLVERAAEQGWEALLGPTITSLQDWVESHYPPEGPLLAAHARELMLVEALLAHPGLLGTGNPWAVARSLIHLFDELTLGDVALPDELTSLLTRLGGAYGLGQHTISALSREATLVHTLWVAWHQQQEAEGVSDRVQIYRQRLRQGIQTPPAQQLYLLAPTTLAPPERQWARTMAAQDRLTVILQGNPVAGIQAEDEHPAAVLQGLSQALAMPVADTSPPATAYSELLEACFAPRGTHQAALHHRAQQFVANHPISPASNRLGIFHAADAEAEAQAVELQIRRWLLAGHQRLAIVTDDRRLARRLRALLERAQVLLHDRAGWALSTTSAAAALERWLQAVEEDFAHQPLTDVLKSAFVLPEWEPETLQAAVYRLEQDIILHENVGRSLARYRRHLAFRRQRLAAAHGQVVESLLDAVETAAQPLLPYVQTTDAQDPQQLLEALHASMTALGLDQAFAADAAGNRILQELTAMQQALTSRQLRLNWTEFRTWLATTLERYNFCLASADDQVQLLTLEQSHLACFDGVIIAAADKTHLPGSGEPTPFFNDAVRAELGLTTQRQRRNRRLHHFRRLLEAAPEVLITTHRQQEGQVVIASPWLQLLEAFHQLAYQHSLGDYGLGALVGRADAQVRTADALAPPTPAPRPAPQVAAQLVPERLSATAYQQLMDCPYQFYATRCLGLAAPEPVRETLAKSDYGQRVHRVLEAFHRDCPDLPGPFDHPLDAAHREVAIQCLEAITHAVFAQDLEDNFVHRGWLRRWQAVIPAYVDWEIKRQAEWQLHAVEVETEIAWSAEVILTGRLDRVDHGVAGPAVVDYKTGALHHRDAVHHGEAVQLPFYALLAGTPVARVEYLSLDRHSFGSRHALEGDELSALAQAVGDRLGSLMATIRAGAALPAWGDAETCARCPMDGLCRRHAWDKP